MKIVINDCFGGMYLSDKAIDRLKKAGLSVSYDGSGVKRNDSRLVEVIEDLGDEAIYNESIKIVEIPDDVTDWYITDEDGFETVREGRSWE